MMGFKEKIMVAGVDDSQSLTSWERFELKPRISDDAPEYSLWYCFTSSFIKWESTPQKFNITRVKEKAIKIALWRPRVLERSKDGLNRENPTVSAVRKKYDSLVTSPQPGLKMSK